MLADIRARRSFFMDISCCSALRLLPEALSPEALSPAFCPLPFSPLLPLNISTPPPKPPFTAVGGEPPVEDLPGFLIPAKAPRREPDALL